MKIQDIIDNYCRFYKVDAPTINVSKMQYIVTISPNGSSVLSLNNSSKLLGQIVGNALKRGTVIYMNNGIYTLVTWENWKSIWSKLFVQKARKNNTPEPNKLHPYKSDIFETMQQKRNHKKPAKRGFECTFRSNTTMNLFEVPRFKTIPLG